MTQTAAWEARTARAIERAVLDYFEGWFEGDAARVERSLHPELVKRRAGETLGITTAARLLELTDAGEGRADAGPVQIVIEDVYENIACVTARGGPYREYLHLVHTAAGWKIANTLWRSI